MVLLNKFKLTVKEESTLFIQNIFNDKKKLIKYLIAILLLFIITFIMSNNYSWYDKTIVKIIAVEDTFTHEVAADKWSTEKYYDQILTGKIMNGQHKGKLVTLPNQYASSGVFDEQYKKSDEVFVEISKDGNQLIGLIKGLKRDKYLIVPFSILMIVILLIIRKKGIFTILSLLINIFIFWFALDLYEQGIDLMVLSRVMMVVFTILSLFLISGFKVKTFAAILSTLATVGIMGIIIHLFVTYSTDVDYAYMDYIFSPNNLDEIFKAQLLIAGLGAIMDIAIMMATMVNELITKDPNIAYKELWKSGRELGHDVMGAMINVMLFTYMCGSIPMIVLKMKMDIDLSTIVSYHMPMELYRFLLGGIGIMIAVPISLLITIILLTKWRR